MKCKRNCISIYGTTNDSSLKESFFGGWMEKSYLARANNMREAAHRKVDAFGLVQGVCGASNFDRAGTATEGQAFFLLMEAAYGEVKMDIASGVFLEQK